MPQYKGSYQLLQSKEIKQIKMSPIPCRYTITLVVLHARKIAAVSSNYNTVICNGKMKLNKIWQNIKSYY